MRHYAAIAAWILFAAIFVFTDGPLSLRPMTGFSPNIERFIALAVSGFAFAVACPRRPVLCLMFLLWRLAFLKFFSNLFTVGMAPCMSSSKVRGSYRRIAAGQLSNRLVARHR